MNNANFVKRVKILQWRKSNEVILDSQTTVLMLQFNFNVNVNLTYVTFEQVPYIILAFSVILN